MEIKKIKQLILILEESDLDELEVTEKDSSVRLVKRKNTGAIKAAAAAIPQPAHVADKSASPASPDTGKASPEEMQGHAVRSPMVGTFYSASSPGSAPFVKVGSRVKEGDTICIVEAMKTLNKIKSDRAGVVKELPVDNAAPVEYHQILCILQ